MTRMSGNDESYGIDFFVNSLLTKWIVDLGATCHMTPQVSDFVPDLLEDTDECIEVGDRYYVTAKKK